MPFASARTRPGTGTAGRDQAVVPGAAAPGAWRSEALCRHLPTDVFFPVGHGPGAQHQAQVAKAICRTCPVKGPCLEYALVSNVAYGVFGGLTEDDRRQVRRRLAQHCGVELGQLDPRRARAAWDAFTRTGGLGPSPGQGLEESA